MSCFQNNFRRICSFVADPICLEAQFIFFLSIFVTLFKDRRYVCQDSGIHFKEHIVTEYYSKYVIMYENISYV